MSDGAARNVKDTSSLAWLIWGVFLLLVAAASGLVALGVFAIADWPLWIAPVVPIALVAGIIFVWNTFYGLCFVAFAIGPLGVLQAEVASITVNLPELMILALVAKEAMLFLLRGEKLSSDFPRWSLAAYIVAASIGLLTAVHLGNSLRAALQDLRQYTEYILFYLLAIHRVRDQRQIRVILLWFTLGLTLLGLHGIFQHFTHIGISSDQVLADEVYHGGIRGGSFYGATPLGGMMVLAVGIAIGLVLSSRSWRVKAICTGCVCMCLVAAVFTNTRASWIAIAVCLIWIFFSVRKTWLMITATVLIGVVFSAVLGHVIIKRMAKMEISHREISLLQRINYYTAAWYIFREYPVLGLGWGCEFSVKGIVKSHHYVKPLTNSRVTKRPPWRQSTVHSAYLQVLVRIGIVGLGALLWFFFRWFLDMLRARPLRYFDESGYNLITCVTAALLGYFLHSALENFFQWPVMAQSLWLLLGLSTVMALQARQAIAGALPVSAAKEA